MRIYFVRHGQSEANLLQVISNRGWQHGLTETGRRQAGALAEALEPQHPVHIYTSPLMRAMETAEIMAKIIGVGITVDQALREYDCGMIEGRADPQAWELYSEARHAWWVEKRPEYRIPGGESLLDVRERFQPFIQRLVEGTIHRELAGDTPNRREHDPNASLMVISHGGIYQCMLPLVLDNVEYALAESLPFPNTGYVLAETTPQGLHGVEWCGIKLEPGHDGYF